MRLPAANVFALLTGALIWGLVWYPYRHLREGGLAAAWATVATYGVGWVILAMLYHRRIYAVGVQRLLFMVGLVAGCANVGFLVAAVSGQVARVVLLFYIAPVWTVPLAWWLLGERPALRTLATTALALSGAAVMLWNPALGWPMPQHWTEWLGLAAGMAFAMGNVLVRKTGSVDISVRSFYICSGCIVVGLGAAWGMGQQIAWPAEPLMIGALTVLVAIVMLLCNWVVQYGLSRTPANLAIVIYLSELVFAALGGWWLAGEALGPKELAGGGLVMVASVLSAWLGRERAQVSKSP